MGLWWIVACSDRGFTVVREPPADAEPDVEVEPARVRFARTAVGCVAAQRVTVRNVGVGPLDVERTWIEGPGDEAYEVERLTGTLVPGASAEVEVRYRPTFVDDAAVDVVVASDDPDEPSVRVPVDGASFDPTWNLDVFRNEPTPIDVLWVIDNSGSMWQERARVTADINSFFGWFKTVLLDYHMGVVTTDVENPVYQGRLVGAPTYVTPDTPDPAATLARAIDVGGLEMGGEAGLAAMELALSEPLLSGHNAGFYRPEARLAVVFLTDEPEQSAPDAAHYESFLAGLKEDRDQIFLAAIVGDRNGGCRGVCDGEPQKANPGEKYLDVTEAFGGFEESICTCDLEGPLERMGFESTLYVRSFPLSEMPGSVAMLEVWVDGDVAGGWSYDPATNAVVFDVAPAVGAEIVARYPIDDPCE